MSVVYLLLGTSSRELDKDRREDVFDDELKVAMGSYLLSYLLSCIKVHALQFSKIGKLGSAMWDIEGLALIN